jgi:hypothetical protein
MSMHLLNTPHGGLVPLTLLHGELAARIYRAIACSVIGLRKEGNSDGFDHDMIVGEGIDGEIGEEGIGPDRQTHEGAASIVPASGVEDPTRMILTVGTSTSHVGLMSMAIPVPVWTCPEHGCSA